MCGWVELVYGGVGMTWGPYRWCGDDMGTTEMMWGPQRQHGDTGWMGWVGGIWGCEDDVKMMGMMWGWWKQCVDEKDNVGKTWGPWGLPISKNEITLEWIKIIRFCLKICDLCTLLLSYRLGLICRLGCAITNSITYYLIQKGTCFFAPVSSHIKNFQFLHRNPIDHV